LNWRPKRVSAERVFAVGDAAGYVEPFTGEGISWALASGLAAAPVAARATRGWDAGMIQEWTTAHRRLIGRRQVACRIAARLLRMPHLCRGLIGALSMTPSLATPVVRWLNMPMPAQVVEN
jgi:flavin-dependent dehydrogenase